MKLIKKKQKHKGKGTTRMVTKTVQNDSFFNFFSPPKGPEEGAEVVSRTLKYYIGLDLHERSFRIA